MADDGGGKKGGEVKHFKGWEGPWLLLLGGAVLALLLLFATRVPGAFCDMGASGHGETAPACVRSWIAAIGPLLAIAAAIAAIGPVVRQWQEMRRQNAILTHDRLIKIASELIDLEVFISSNLHSAYHCNLKAEMYLRIISQKKIPDTDNIIDLSHEIISSMKDLPYVLKSPGVLFTGISEEEIYAAYDAILDAQLLRCDFIQKAKRGDIHEYQSSLEMIVEDMKKLIEFLNSVAALLRSRISRHKVEILSLEAALYLSTSAPSSPSGPAPAPTDPPAS